MLWATKQLISLNFSMLHNATAHYCPIRHYNALLTEVYWCKSTRKRCPIAKKTRGEIVQVLWVEVIQMSVWLRQYGAACFILSSSSGCVVSYDDIMMALLQHKATCSVSSDVINYTICLNTLPHAFLCPHWDHAHNTNTHTRACADTHILLTTHPRSVMELPYVASCRYADSHQETLISSFSSGLLIPFPPICCLCGLSHATKVWIRPEVITLNT